MPPSAAQANHENNLEKEVSWSTAKWMKADLFWRDGSPSTNMTWTSMGTTNCCLCRKTERTLRDFGNFADFLRQAAEGVWRCKLYMKYVVVWMFTRRA